MKIKEIALKFYARDNVGNRWYTKKFGEIVDEIKTRLLKIEKYDEEIAQQVISEVFRKYPKKTYGMFYEINGNKILLYDKNLDEDRNSWGYDECEMTIIFADQKPLTRQLLNKAKEIIKKRDKFEVRYEKFEGVICEAVMRYKFDKYPIARGERVLRAIEFIINGIESHAEYHREMGMLYTGKGSGAPTISMNPYSWGYDKFGYEVDNNKIRITFTYVASEGLMRYRRVYDEWVEFRKIKSKQKEISYGKTN